MRNKVEDYQKHLAQVAMQGAHTDFIHLLPPSARTHLQMALAMEDVRHLYEQVKPLTAVVSFYQPQ